MIKGKLNQLSNTSNQYQTEAKRVLCVCSAGMLRSPTLANVLYKEYGYNTRAVGSSKPWALIPISEALIKWADQIVFVNKDNYLELNQEERDYIKDECCDVVYLSIEDDYTWNHPELISDLLYQYEKKVIIHDSKHCDHMYSKSMDQPYPRQCVKCGDIEIVKQQKELNAST